MSAGTPDIQADPGLRDASVVVARDGDGHVAVLSAYFPAHCGDYLFLPGGRREPGETPEECARRELREESGITATEWRTLGSFALTVTAPARVHLYEARGLTCGPQQLTPTEQDFKLGWLSMPEALRAAAAGRFLLPAGPLALLLVERGEGQGVWGRGPRRRV
jgi:ADP-ribose pyrophosphatase